MALLGLTSETSLAGDCDVQKNVSRLFTAASFIMHVYGIVIVRHSVPRDAVITKKLASKPGAAAGIHN